MIGQVINGYKILRELGCGGMATVYYAQNNIGNEAAIKVLKKELSTSGDIIARFNSEARIMKALSGVVGVRKAIDCVVFEGASVIIMEYLEGCDLKEYIKQNGVIKDSEFIRNIGKQVLIALNEAHKLKDGSIIHRDIKPSNLFLTKSGEIKILDFGISKILFGGNSDATERETTTRQQMGTISYMSPEQIRCTANVDCRTDIYSFGATLYYLMTGDDPLEMDEDSFDQIGDKDLILAIKHATMKKVDKRTPSCDAFLKELLIVDAVVNIQTTSSSRDRRQAESKTAPSNKLVEMVKVEGGTFTMGGKDDKPTHSVTLSTYYIGKYPVTQRQWREVMGNNPSWFKGDDLPVEDVSWFDAIKYCNALNKREGYEACYRINGTTVEYRGASAGYRLPTEAEWEFAARGGNKKDNCEYSGSNNLGDVAWYTENSNQTHAVGKKKPNGLGLYDMSGNVWEWCWDWYGTYSSSSQTNPLGATSGSFRVYRGGSWYYSASFCTVSYRINIAPVITCFNLGFRLAFACSSK